MKVQWVLFSISVVLCGCSIHQPVQSNSKKGEEVNAVWFCEGQMNWQFTLLESGTISEVIRPDEIHMDLSEGAMQKEANGLYTHYIWGPCTWSYDPESCKLSVMIIIDDFTVKTSAFEFSATVKDTFEGTISGDGKTWTTEWTTIETYRNPEQTKFTEPRILVFQRADDTPEFPQ